MNKKVNNPLFNELKKLRNEWPEGINPVTKVIPDKKKEQKKGRQKYKGREYQDDER